ncbi:gamma-glutamyltransferase [Thiorhodovibrio frisius]|uniref:Glutathione hydrolase proenzyme n=1 Tax=Thiorhodovibrio frisius TaxID=631362 RepID=H8YZ55_9GAMM|nr:gamma-glutamyltransferase [Thiorhodovibrio frisius]EIC21982.1 gamma-glutamyltranspeptidase [Thiorhodovibrio frisius]WPL24271.1 Gamma-glutamyltranspeptidase precursor [Thiorhodovibrio frisius]
MIPTARPLRVLPGVRLLCAILLFGLSAAHGAPVTPPAAAIASAHPAATQAGEQILAAGGNAFDAAIAVAATLAVVEPYSSGLGGGGFWLLHLSGEDRSVFVDGRERAPLAASPDMYLNNSGELVPELALNGPLAAGIPGVPAALDHLAAHYARLPLSQSLAPAIRLARDGFTIDAHYRRLADWRLEVLRASPAADEQFLLAGEVPPEGHLLRQPELAGTLERIAARGRDGFYTGELAEQLVAGVREAGGIWTMEDLRDYRIIERAPIVFDYGDWTITSAPPPSAGGVGLAQMLGMLADLNINAQDRVTRVHLSVEAMRRAYRDRAAFLGDPDQVEMPLARLMHPFYLVGLARDIDPNWATPSQPPALQEAAGEPADEGRDTTHFSILDKEGNRVAATLSINYPFGAGFVPPGTGVLLNDEMDDFAAQPGVANAYGLVGGEANAIAPGKRMLSSMSPTFVESDQGVAILGTPGGSRIITMVLNAVLALTEGGTPADWVAAPRFHHQYLPDVIQHEPAAFDAEEAAALQAMGHRLEPVDPGMFGNMQVIYWDRSKQRVQAASDPRGQGEAKVLTGAP